MNEQESPNTFTERERARFINTLEHDQEFRQTVRLMLLSQELIDLPERVAKFMAYVESFINQQLSFNARVEQFIEEQRETNARVEGFIEEQRETNARVDGFIEEQRETNARVDGFIEEQRETNARVENRINRMADDIGVLKGNAARQLLRVQIDEILDLCELEFEVILSRSDLVAIARKANASESLEFGDRQSFYAADLVIRGIDRNGEVRYIAAEASYTADRRDTDRAQRNARYITQFTGLPAEAVVASIRNDRYVQGLIAEGEIRWLRFDERELQPD